MENERIAIRCLALILSAILAGCASRPPVQAPKIIRPGTPSARAADQTPVAPAAAPATSAPVQPVTPPLSAPAVPPLAPPVPVPVEVPPVPVIPAVPFDKAAALQAWVDQQDRLYRVAAPLLINNTELCPRHARNLLGLTAKTRYSYAGDFEVEANSVLGLDERLRVMSVLPGSSAALAGILKGDILLVVGIDPLPQGVNAEAVGMSLVGSEMRGRTSVNLTVLRDAERVEINIPLVQACAIAISLGNTDDVNSYADGDRVMVTRGMLNFVKSDEELAYVLAKEIAHNVLTPSTRADMAAVMDRLRSLKAAAPDRDLGAEASPYSPAEDAMADTLALYMLVRAGYRIDDASNFWRRLASAYPANMRNSFTALHPATDHRLSAMSVATIAIQMKQEQDLPLIP